jgi:hypothetical protein
LFSRLDLNANHGRFLGHDHSGEDDSLPHGFHHVDTIVVLSRETRASWARPRGSSEAPSTTRKDEATQNLSTTIVKATVVIEHFHCKGFMYSVGDAVLSHLDEKRSDSSVNQYCELETDRSHATEPLPKRPRRVRSPMRLEKVGIITSIKVEVSSPVVGKKKQSVPLVTVQILKTP